MTAPGDPTHRNDEMHRGMVPDDQLASGTPAVGDAPLSNGDGTRTWGAATGPAGPPGADGGSSFEPVTDEFVASGGTPETFTLTRTPLFTRRVFVAGLRADQPSVGGSGTAVTVNTTAADIVTIDYEAIPEGDMTIRYKVTLNASLFPSGGEVIPLGLNLVIGDTIMDVAISETADWDGNQFYLGRSPVTGADALNSTAWPGEAGADTGPYLGAGLPADYPMGMLGHETYNGVGRLPAEVTVAHELAALATDPATTGSVTLVIYVLPAAATVTLPTLS